MSCVLCETESVVYRVGVFKGKEKQLCSDCLKQFKVVNLDKVRVVLE